MRMMLTTRLAGGSPEGPAEVANLARAFKLAGDRADEDRPVVEGLVESLVAPAVVNWCLSLELYFKALVFNSGAHPGKVHSLLKLYDLLPHASRAAIEERWIPLVASLDLRLFLGDIANYFMEVRYDYEVSERAYLEGPIRLALEVVSEHCQTVSWTPGALPALSRRQ